MPADAPAPADVFRLLLAAYGPQGWWPVAPRGATRPAYRPGRWGALTERQRLEVCVGALLAQNTSWTNADRALRRLHAAGALSLARLGRMPRARLAGLIRSSGYFNQKAARIKTFAGHARRAAARGLAAWLGRAPLEALRGELLGLRGVGPETADSILLYAGGRPAFVVDAYTLRIGARLGWFRGATAYHEARSYLAGRFPPSPRELGEFHALLVVHAKEHCRKTPACPGCPLLAVCRHGRRHAA